MRGPWGADAVAVRARWRVVGMVAAVVASSMAASGPAGAEPGATSTTSTTSTTDPSSAEALGAPPGVVLAPAGADEAGRRQALAELRVAERELRAAVTTQKKRDKVVGPLERRVAEAAAAVEHHAVRDREAAARLAEARDRVRRMAVAGYVVGGEVPQVDYLLGARDHTDLSRRHSLVKTAAEAKAGALAAYEAARAAASAEHEAALAAADAAGAELRQARSEAAAAAAVVELHRTEVNHRRQLADVIAAAAPVGTSGIPRLFLDAYRKAAAAMGKRNASCRVGWTAIAALGHIEANHGRYRGARLALNGDVYPRIVGIPLDGTRGTRVVRDTDDGRLDGDPEFDHAVGPMQFIPSTWVRVAQDGNGDRKADPNNAYDATLTAAVYLCRAVPSGGLDKEDAVRRAFFSYNHSNAYVDLAVGWMRAYDAIAATV